MTPEENQRLADIQTIERLHAQFIEAVKIPKRSMSTRKAMENILGQLQERYEIEDQELRMEGLISEHMLQDAVTQVHTVMKDLLNDGFEFNEARDYIMTRAHQMLEDFK